MPLVFVRVCMCVCSQVSALDRKEGRNLVFYAQSTMTVISGQKIMK